MITPYISSHFGKQGGKYLQNSADLIHTQVLIIVRQYLRINFYFQQTILPHKRIVPPQMQA